MLRDDITDSQAGNDAERQERIDNIEASIYTPKLTSGLTPAVVEISRHLAVQHSLHVNSTRGHVRVCAACE